MYLQIGRSRSQGGDGGNMATAVGLNKFVINSFRVKLKLSLATGGFRGSHGVLTP